MINSNHLNLVLDSGILNSDPHSFQVLFANCKWTGADEQEHATPLHSCHGVFIDRFIFRSNLLWMRLSWECHNQSQETNWRHCVTGPELPFFNKSKGILKIDQSVKRSWHRLSMGVACSYSLAPEMDYSTLTTLNNNDNLNYLICSINSSTSNKQPPRS